MTTDTYRARCEREYQSIKDCPLYTEAEKAEIRRRGRRTPGACVGDPQYRAPAYRSWV